MLGASLFLPVSGATTTKPQLPILRWRLEAVLSCCVNTYGALYVSSNTQREPFLPRISIYDPYPIHFFGIDQPQLPEEQPVNSSFPPEGRQNSQSRYTRLGCALCLIRSTLNGLSQGLLYRRLGLGLEKRNRGDSFSLPSGTRPFGR